MSLETHKWRAYWVGVAIAAVTILDMTKVNTALPALETALGASSTELQIIVAGYVLTFGLALVPAGRIGDQRSRKTLFLVGLIIFTGMSVLAGFANDPTTLLVARLLQGVGAGIQMPQVLGVVQELFQGKERGKAFGLFGATIGLATAFGPGLGGLAIELGGPVDGWRWIFWMNLPLGLLLILGVIFFMPESAKKKREPLSLDPMGIVLFAVTVIALMWPFLFTTGSPEDDPARWWLLVVFAVALAAFIWWESRYARRGRAPLVPLTLFRKRSFRNGLMIGTLYFAGLPPMFLLITIFMQQGLGLTALIAGLITTGFALSSAYASWWAGARINTMGARLIVSGMVIVLAVMVSMAIAASFLPHEWIPWIVTGLLFIGGIGGGLVVSANQTLLLEDVPVREGGLAGSVAQLGQRIGNAIGTAVALSIYYATLFRESGSVPADQVPFDALRLGLVAVALLIALALIVAVVDLRGRGGVNDLISRAAE